MRLAVFSDTHGFADYMVSAARRAQPDMLIHLGDCTRDTSALERALSDIPLRCVRGNCDFAALAPESDIFFAGGVKVFAAHGHRYGVKSSDGALVERALKVNARILLYGHTHEPVTRYEDGLYIMNPGSARQGRYGMIDITPNGIACILCEL